MMIIYDAKRLIVNSVQELFNVDGKWMNDRDWDFRSPLVVKFYDAKAKKAYLVTVNHLARSDENLRKSQAIGLRLWAKKTGVARDWTG